MSSARYIRLSLETTFTQTLLYAIGKIYQLIIGDDLYSNIVICHRQDISGYHWRRPLLKHRYMSSARYISLSLETTYTQTLLYVIGKIYQLIIGDDLYSNIVICHRQDISAYHWRRPILKHRYVSSARYISLSLETTYSKYKSNILTYEWSKMIWKYGFALKVAQKYRKLRVLWSADYQMYLWNRRTYSLLKNV